MSKPKGDRKTHEKVTRMKLYTVKIRPTQTEGRGAAHDACYMDIGCCDVGDPRVLFY